MTSYLKSDSVNQCIFSPGTFLPNFIPIVFEITALDFVARSRPKKKNNNHIKNKMSNNMGSVPDPKNCEKSEKQSSVYEGSLRLER